MAWREGKQKTIKRVDVNKELRKIDEFDSVDAAKIAFVDFCKANPFFACKLLFGFSLFPFQEILIKGMESKDNFLGLVSRGAGKSTIGAIFCALYAALNPNSRIVVLSISFRQAREILLKINEIATSGKAERFKRCCKSTVNGVLKQGTDEYVVELNNGSKIIALPLGKGEKIRGQRAKVVFCDEFLGFNEKIVQEVISPFRSTNTKDTYELSQLVALEDQMIKEGKMKEEERTQIEANKFVAMSTATSKLEYLYELYEKYLKSIDEGKEQSSYGVAQISYKVLPKALLNDKFVEEQEATLSPARLSRELGAQFTDDTSGFFSYKAMIDNRYEVGQKPYFEIKGDPQAEYILSIDPSFDDAPTADNFAMCLYKIVDYQKRKIMQVHSYAVAGGPLVDRFRYLRYMLKNFNVVYVILDSTGGGESFIKSLHESAYYQSEFGDIKLNLFEHDFKEENYQLAVMQALASYGKSEGRIVHEQNYVGWVQRANYDLSSDIQKNRILFAGTPMDEEMEKLEKQALETGLTEIKFINRSKYNEDSITPESLAVDIVERQQSLIDQTIEETASVVPHPQANGGYRFDLPNNLKRMKGEQRPRKDLYSCLLMANHAVKCYLDMMQFNSEEAGTDLSPMDGGDLV